ncbi:MAG: biotin--[acetyl-CoA-carboxylase] ligase [Turicibacter sp.]|nr:biotin--[acetyl-CoA-carboxylase] ligase [Turicibacter sp.]
MDRLAQAEIQSLSQLATAVKVFDSVASTNTLAIEYAKTTKNPHGTIFVADTQTGGYGRKQRSFFSPPNHGIYMSIISQANTPDASLVTIAAAVAVCKAIGQLCGVFPQIKWVNDLLLLEQGEYRKICGILAEMVRAGEQSYVVVGIGVNFLKYADLPSELEPIVGAVFDSAHNPPTTTRNSLTAAIIDNILSDCDYNAIMEFYRKHSCILGKKIRVICEKPYFATALAIDGSGRLVVENETGQIITLISGEVSIAI